MLRGRATAYPGRMASEKVQKRAGNGRRYPDKRTRRRRNKRICLIWYGRDGQNGPNMSTVRETLVLRIVENAIFVRSGCLYGYQIILAMAKTGIIWHLQSELLRGFNNSDGQNEHKKTAPGGAAVGRFTLHRDPRRSHRAGRADCPHQGEALRARFSRNGSSLQKTDRSLLHSREYNPQRCSFPVRRSHQYG